MAETGESLTERIKRFVSLKGSEQIRTPKNVRDHVGNVIAEDRVIMAVVDDNDEANAPTKYDSTATTEAYYPTSRIVDDTQVLTVVGLTASAKTGTYEPTAGYINEVEFIYFALSATAAGRDLNAYIYDGTNSIPIYQSGAGGLASGTTAVIYPVDLTAIYVPPTQGWSSPITTHDATYLRFVNTDLTAAEVCNIYIHARIYPCEGL